MVETLPNTLPRPLPKARTGIPLVLPHALLAFGLLVFAAASERGTAAGSAVLAAPGAATITVAALGRN